jgi:hypothetical protein
VTYQIRYENKENQLAKIICSLCREEIDIPRKPKLGEDWDTWLPVLLDLVNTLHCHEKHVIKRFSRLESLKQLIREYM